MNLIKWLMCVCFSISVLGQEFTLFVKTQSALKPINLQFVKSNEMSLDFMDLIKSTLEFDILNSGYCEKSSRLDSTTIHLKFLIHSDHIDITLTQYEKNTQWKFPISISSKEDLVFNLHKISDEMLMELFGEYGISSDRIVYALRDPNLFKSELVFKYFDLSSAKQLTFDGNFKLSPIFLPNGEMPAEDLIYVSYANGPSKIFKQNLKEKNGKELINLRGNHFLPSLSPSGEFISFISDASGTVDLFVVGLNKQFLPTSKPVQVFSYKNSVQASSSFHPKSSRIAFVSDFEKKPKIYEVDLLKTLKIKKTPDPELITPYDVEATCPAYSPDGKKLAYCSLVEGVRQIFIYDLENKIHYALTDGPHHKENPSWASNSLHIAYNTTCTDHEIYVVNINQKIPIRISDGYGYKHYPCWERIKKRKIRDSI